MPTFLLALLVAVSQAHAGKKKGADPGPPPAAAEAAAPAIDPAFEADIRKLLEITGSAALGTQMRDQMLGMLRVQYSDLPQSVWDEVAREFDVASLLELTVPIYAKHLTQDEVRQLIGFYESPLGRKMIEVMPVLMQEAMVAGQAWGRDAAQRVQQRLKQHQAP